MRIALVNGALLAPEQAFVSVYDRGFLYGDSVFETLRTYGGKAYAIEEHLLRLVRSAERVLITIPVALAELRDEVLRAIEASKNLDSYVRIMVTRGTGPMGLDPDLAEHPSRVVLVEPLVVPSSESYRSGIGAIFVRTARATDATSAEGAKVANYLTSLLALREARLAGAAEALVVDGRGFVVEGATSNLFVVAKGELATPPEEAGILPGITRAHLLEAARNLGIVTHLQPVSESALLAADEVFISSSIREVLPVVRVGSHTIGSGVPGLVTRRLHAEFRKRAGAPGPLPWDLPA